VTLTFHLKDDSLVLECFWAKAETAERPSRRKAAPDEVRKNQEEEIMKDLRTIMDRIRAFHEHAESAKAIGSEAEAQAFAAKVQELLTAYKLSRADLQAGAGQKREEPIDKSYLTWRDLGLEPRKVRVGWTEQLGRLVADAYYCRFIIYGWDGNVGMLVGETTDREVAGYMFATVGRLLWSLAEVETRKFNYRAWRDAGKSTTGSIPAEHYEGLLGKTARRDLPADTHLRIDDVS